MKDYNDFCHGPLTRYVKMRFAHTPGMPRTFSPPPPVSNPDMHHGTYVTHVPWCMSGLLTNGFLWNRWRGKCSRHSRRMRNLQFYASGKRSISVKKMICIYIYVCVCVSLNNSSLKWFIHDLSHVHYRAITWITSNVNNDMLSTGIWEIMVYLN